MPIQGSLEWLDYRRTRIGASDASAIMGVSPWCTAFQLWQRKLGLIADQFVSPSMKRGTELEPVVRALYIKATGNVVMPAVVEHPEYPYIFASLDGFNDEGVVVEIKTANKIDHEKAAARQIPEKYLPQVMHQMAVTGAEYVDYVSFCPGSTNEFICFRVDRDEDYINKLIEAEKEFYLCMINKVAPGQNNAIDHLILKRKELLEIERDIKEQLDENKHMLIAECKEESAVGAGYKITKSTVKGQVDYSKIEALQGLDLEQYRKPEAVQWRITISGE